MNPAGLLASIPSPAQGSWSLGPIPIRAYALFIVAGIVVAVWWGGRRYVARGGRPGTIADIALWAVPFGIVGGRLYHVLSDWQLYFGPDGRGFVAALRVWDGGLGIWGAVAVGALGAWIGARRAGVALPPVADAIAPAIALAQAIGRWGNYFNQELFGSPTTLPWGLEIDVANRPTGYAEFDTFQPTFLYESLWLIGVVVVLVWADRRYQMGHGRVFALYVALYCLGRLWIEALRIDAANTILGLRLNIWTAGIVGLGALAYFLWSLRTKPGREEIVSEQDSDTVTT
ncbi:MAG: prolipoprotein diacylglyceryl transferase [Candidatus Nanopelagicales bacterium]|nr:prolipoprotein diacylglyceryl transferase [Candidatus Nanopelagicales bacterium]MDP4825701.1 prolipoprotein diacylglyceryl transferase [Candidatus Nanopelagicales bacterium]MDP4888062.1 prolipoprotein diacylglyceryl transferase [Candidatus Nanopelagicales bacterium]